MRLLWLALFLLFCSSLIQAESVYLSPEDFLSQTFGENVPAAQAFWFTKAHREAATRILGHAPAGARLRYWQENGRSVWIMDEIGKEYPITFGVVVNQQAIEQVRVLIYRESRGWEIRSAAFARQFLQAHLAAEQKLDRQIDGITGATLSVRAMQNVTRLALYLDQQINVATR